MTDDLDLSAFLDRRTPEDRARPAAHQARIRQNEGTSEPSGAAAAPGTPSLADARPTSPDPAPFPPAPDRIQPSEATPQPFRPGVAILSVAEAVPSWTGQWHAAAEQFPLLPPDELSALAASIAAHGLQHELVMDRAGLGLDGRNRLAACDMAGVAPRWRVLADGIEPVAFVVAANVDRRHLDTSQRAMIAAEIATMRQGARTDLKANLSANAERSQRAAATLLKVSADSVGRAAVVKDKGAPELKQAVRDGTVSVAAAAAIAENVPADQQKELVARGEREILQAARAIRKGKAETRRAAKLATIGELAAASMKLPNLAEIGAKQRYAVLLADPPWQFEDPPVGETCRSVENHYPTMTMADLLALPVGAVATTTAVLYLWSTNAHLASAMKLIEAWGFDYKGNIVWDKEIIGLGYWVRNRHELLLIAARGGMPAPPEATRPDSVVRAVRARHSEKPASFHEIVERCFPDLPKLELFARAERPGWDAWGNQALRLAGLAPV